MAEAMDCSDRPVDQTSKAGFAEIARLGAFLCARCGSLEMAFDSLDVTSRGYVSCDEFMHALDRLGYTEDAENLEQVFRAVEGSDNGHLERQAFLAAFDPPCYRLWEEKQVTPSKGTPFERKSSPFQRHGSPSIRRSAPCLSPESVLGDCIPAPPPVTEVVKLFEGRIASARGHPPESARGRPPDMTKQLFIEDLMNNRISEEVGALRQHLDEESHQCQADIAGLRVDVQALKVRHNDHSVEAQVLDLDTKIELLKEDIEKRFAEQPFLQQPVSSVGSADLSPACTGGSPSRNMAQGNAILKLEAESEFIVKEVASLKLRLEESQANAVALETLQRQANERIDKCFEACHILQAPEPMAEVRAMAQRALDIASATSDALSQVAAMHPPDLTALWQEVRGHAAAFEDFKRSYREEREVEAIIVGMGSKGNEPAQRTKRHEGQAPHIDERLEAESEVVNLSEEVRRLDDICLGIREQVKAHVTLCASSQQRLTTDLASTRGDLEMQRQHFEAECNLLRENLKVLPFGEGHISNHLNVKCAGIDERLVAVAQEAAVKAVQQRMDESEQSLCSQVKVIVETDSEGASDLSSSAGPAQSTAAEETEPKVVQLGLGLAPSAEASLAVPSPGLLPRGFGPGLFPQVPHLGSSGLEGENRRSTSPLPRRASQSTDALDALTGPAALVAPVLGGSLAVPTGSLPAPVLGGSLNVPTRSLPASTRHTISLPAARSAAMLMGQEIDTESAAPGALDALRRQAGRLLRELAESISDQAKEQAAWQERCDSDTNDLAETTKDLSGCVHRCTSFGSAAQVEASSKCKQVEDRASAGRARLQDFFQQQRAQLEELWSSYEKARSTWEERGPDQLDGENAADWAPRLCTCLEGLESAIGKQAREQEMWREGLCADSDGLAESCNALNKLIRAQRCSGPSQVESSMRFDKVHELTSAMAACLRDFMNKKCQHLDDIWSKCHRMHATMEQAQPDEKVSKELSAHTFEVKTPVTPALGRVDEHAEPCAITKALSTSVLPVANARSFSPPRRAQAETQCVVPSISPFTSASSPAPDVGCQTHMMDRQCGNTRAGPETFSLATDRGDLSTPCCHSVTEQALPQNLNRAKSVPVIFPLQSIPHPTEATAIPEGAPCTTPSYGVGFTQPNQAQAALMAQQPLQGRHPSSSALPGVAPAGPPPPQSLHGGTRNSRVDPRLNQSPTNASRSFTPCLQTRQQNQVAAPPMPPMQTSQCGFRAPAPGMERATMPVQSRGMGSRSPTNRPRSPNGLQQQQHPALADPPAVAPPLGRRPTASGPCAGPRCGPRPAHRRLG
mmetsp:Transcript_30209/g.64265  ORF Transcript_30209/g.64265 Transcript_30209/m.64265 type:complete len:1311 (-) Transcript_30209:95-4027(-)